MNHEPDYVEHEQWMEAWMEAQIAWAVQAAMKKRCEAEQHGWENFCSSTFQLYRQCRWCGEVER